MASIKFLGIAHKADGTVSEVYIGQRRDALTGERVNLISRSKRLPVPGTVELFPGVRVLSVDTGPRDCGE